MSLEGGSHASYEKGKSVKESTDKVSSINKKTGQGENLDSLKYWNKKEENYIQEIKKTLGQTTIQKINEISKGGSLLTLLTTTKKEQDDLKKLRIQIASLVKNYLAKFQNILKNEGLEKEDRIYKKLTNIINFLEKKESLTEDTISILKMNRNEGFDPIKLIARAITHVQNYMRDNIGFLRGKKKSESKDNQGKAEKDSEISRRNTQELQRLLPEGTLKTFLNQNKKENYQLKSELLIDGLNKIYGIGRQAAEKGLSEIQAIKEIDGGFQILITDKSGQKQQTFTLSGLSKKLDSKLKEDKNNFGTFLKKKLSEHINYLNKKRQKNEAAYLSKGTIDKNLNREKVENKAKEKDLQEQEKKYKTKAELLEQNNDKKIMDSTAGTSEKTDFIKELDNIPQEDILKNIPKETYKRYLEAFKKSPEVEALEFENEKLNSLLSKLFKKNQSDPDLIKLQKVRATSPIREKMITRERQQFQQIIKEKAKLTALKAGKVLFEKLGISATNGKVIQKAESKSYYQYSDANNPKVSYQFTPITGEFSISTNNINDATKSIDITGTKQKKLFKIPGFTELMNQADPKTILPDKRLDSYEKIKQVIETKLGKNIQHNLGDTEATSIKHEIEKEQLETRIITKIKSGLGLKKEQLNKNTDPGYYSFFAPILKTFKQPNISTNQLKILKQFADRIGERGQFTNGKTPTETNEVVQYTDFKQHIATPRNLIKYALSGEKIRDIETLQNNREKSNFTIGKIMNRLEKSGGKGG
ncbi:MAG: hypothetical protein HXJ92_01015, partial [candidate division SR1 bacterium]|nr:hypothetical protein [candidate division SR1 bacterium]